MCSLLNYACYVSCLYLIIFNLVVIMPVYSHAVMHETHYLPVPVFIYLA